LTGSSSSEYLRKLFKTRLSVVEFKIICLWTVLKMLRATYFVAQRRQHHALANGPWCGGSVLSR